MKYERIITAIVLPNLDLIRELRMKGQGFVPIAKRIGCSFQELNFIVNNYTIYFEDYLKTIKDVKEIERERKLHLQISRAWECNSERCKLVEDALFKSCFDHTVSYKTFNKKTGEIEEVEQVIPASFNAQRYFLINRCANKWQNENKDSIAPITDKISSIKVEWKSSEEDKQQQERVEKIEKDL